MEHVKLLRVSHLARRHRMHWMVASRSCGAQPRHKLRACKHNAALDTPAVPCCGCKTCSPCKERLDALSASWKAPGDYPARPWPAMGRQL